MVCSTCTGPRVLSRVRPRLPREGRRLGRRHRTRAPAHHPPAPPHGLTCAAPVPHHVCSHRRGTDMAVTLDELGGWRPVLLALTAGQDLTADQAHAAMTEILAGAATDAQIAAYIVALRMKGEAVDEVSGMVDAMLEASDPIHLAEAAADAVDIVGHRRRRQPPSPSAQRVDHGLLRGRRRRRARVQARQPQGHAPPAARSTCSRRSAWASTSTAPGWPRCVEQAGLGFCFARAFHPAMRHAGPVRAELGIPTAVQLHRPAVEPGPGVASGDRGQRPGHGPHRRRRAPAPGLGPGHGGARPRRHGRAHHHRSLHRVGAARGRRAAVRARPGRARARRWSIPTSCGGGDAEANAAIAASVFGGEAGPDRDIVTLNAAAGLVVGGRVDDLAAGLELAAASIDDGRAAAALDRLREVSHRSPSNRSA